jgi:PRD1 phage membrane DNA delivery
LQWSDKVKQLSDAITKVLIGCILVAIIAVIVSQKSASAALVQSFGSAFDGALTIAEAPISNNQGAVATGLGTTGGTTNNAVVARN